MKINKLVRLLAVFLILGGVAVVCAPYASDWLFKLQVSRQIRQYDRAWRSMDTAAEFARAADYNQKLASAPPYFYDLTQETTEDTAAYLSLLDPVGNGMLGYLEIPSISLRLPIWHGTGEEVLLKGSGHQAGSTLPTGEGAGHAVIYGHSGQASAKLFNAVDRMQTGDPFVIHVLNRTLTYTVTGTETVLPEVLEDGSVLSVQPEEDLVTLITCTPYGINSHRLLVQGRLESCSLREP